MTTTATVLIQSKAAPTSQNAEYTSTDVTTLIDKFTATNTTGGPLTISVNIVPSGDSAGSSNLIRPTKTIQAGEVYRFPELVGQVLAPGDFISMVASGAGITVRASGRQSS